MFELTPERTAIIVLSLALVPFVVAWLSRVDTKIEKRRKAASDTARVLESLGLKLVPAMLANYSVGDYDGFCADLYHIAQVLQNPVETARLVGDVFYAQLPLRLAGGDEERARICKAVAEFNAAHPELIKAAGLALAA
jgi:hypothetical protein